jgi:hypothetical protein
MRTLTPSSTSGPGTTVPARGSLPCGSAIQPSSRVSDACAALVIRASTTRSGVSDVHEGDQPLQEP